MFREKNISKRYIGKPKNYTQNVYRSVQKNTRKTCIVVQKNIPERYYISDIKLMFNL